MINLTPAAVQEIKRIQKSRSQPHSYFRLGVKPGGCSGFYYTLDLAETPQTSDRVFECQSISIVVDAESEPYLEELKLDYAEDLMGGGFRFYNPNASNSCGCGLSFTPQST
jgi:iron-sulfur cluster assembly protein